jgi:hypothetical protein
MLTRVCRKCKEPKDEETCFPHELRSDGTIYVRSTCQECRTAAVTEYRRGPGRPKKDAYNAAYVEENREELRQYHRENNKTPKRRGQVRNALAAARARNRAYVIEAKNRPCADCGNCYPSYVMDLDHVRGEKVGNVGSMVGQGIALEHIRVEIEKCDVVCSNCHRIRTHERGQYLSQKKAA